MSNLYPKMEMRLLLIDTKKGNMGQLKIDGGSTILQILLLLYSYKSLTCRTRSCFSNRVIVCPSKRYFLVGLSLPFLVYIGFVGFRFCSAFCFYLQARYQHIKITKTGTCTNHLATYADQTIFFSSKQKNH